jgi:SAM-dependent methyltransferase
MLTLRSDQLAVRDRYSGRWQRAWKLLVENGPGEFWRIICSRRGGTIGFIAGNIRYLIAVHLNRRFDRKYSVDTAGDIATLHLDVVGENKAYGAAFLSTPEKTFRRALDFLPVNVENFTFIDIGAGKGRVLLLAATRNFREIIGVEYAPELVACARRNFLTYRNAAQICRDLSCICADATTFDPPPGDCIFYFLRPFEDNIMAAMLRRIKDSYDAAPRKIVIMFVSPAEPDYAPPHETVVATGFLRRTRLTLLPFDWAAVTRFQLAVYESDPH